MRLAIVGATFWLDALGLECSRTSIKLEVDTGKWINHPCRAIPFIGILSYRTAAELALKHACGSLTGTRCRPGVVVYRPNEE